MPLKYKNKSLRITGGAWRSCKIRFADNPNIKPTTDFVRETLGSWLAPLIHEKMCCLDLFAGSGVLGIELLSRGAKAASFVDISARNLANIQANLAALDKNATKKCSFIKQDARRYIPQIDKHFDVIFLDPPFNTNYLNQAAHLINQHLVSATESLVYVEYSRYQEFVPPETWQLYKNKARGGVIYQLWLPSS